MQERKTTFHNTSHTFVPAERAPQPPATIAPIHVGELLPPTVQVAHSRQDDNAITHAKATLLVSTAYVVAAAMITLGLLLIVWLFRGLGDSWATYTFTGLVVWGCTILLALWGNRRQSLHHSASGIAHHELDSRERLAKYAIDQHVRLLLKRWKVDDGD